MNIMYADRQYLLVPHADVSLVERLILGNNLRKNPYKLWFIDDRTMKAHHDNLPDADQITTRHGWAFYMPTRECPLTYRELAVWFMLWSIQGKHKTLYFQQSFTGLETLLGLGRRQASELADRLEEPHHLIKVVRTEGWPWFYLFPFAPYDKWFVPLQSNAVPKEILELEKLRKEQSPEPSQKVIQPEAKQPVTPQYSAEEALVMLNEAIPKVVRNSGFYVANRWWNKEVEMFGTIANYREEDALVIQEAHAKLRQMQQSNIQPEKETTNEPRYIEEQPEEGEDDFMRRLKTM
jgi:hypothetical protein